MIRAVTRVPAGLDGQIGSGAAVVI